MRATDLYEKIDLIRLTGWQSHQQALTNLQEIDGLDELHEKFDSKLSGIKKAVNKMLDIETKGASFDYEAPPKKIHLFPGVTNLTIHKNIENAMSALERMKEQIKAGGWGVVDTRNNKRHKMNTSGKSLFTKAIKDAKALMEVYEAYEEDLEDE